MRGRIVIGEGERDVIGVFAVALAHRLGGLDSRSLSDAKEIKRQFAFSFDVFHLFSLKRSSN